MADCEGDPAKRPIECKEGVFTPDAPGSHTGVWGSCPHLKEVSSASDMDGETYDCNVCGRHYRLYYDDMR